MTRETLAQIKNIMLDAAPYDPDKNAEIYRRGAANCHGNAGFLDLTSAMAACVNYLGYGSEEVWDILRPHLLRFGGKKEGILDRFLSFCIPNEQYLVVMKNAQERDRKRIASLVHMQNTTLAIRAQMQAEVDEANAQAYLGVSALTAPSTGPVINGHVGPAMPLGDQIAAGYVEAKSPIGGWQEALAPDADQSTGPVQSVPLGDDKSLAMVDYNQWKTLEWDELREWYVVVKSNGDDSARVYDTKTREWFKRSEFKADNVQMVKAPPAPKGAKPGRPMTVGAAVCTQPHRYQVPVCSRMYFDMGDTPLNRRVYKSELSNEGNNTELNAFCGFNSQNPRYQPCDDATWAVACEYIDKVVGQESEEVREYIWNYMSWMVSHPNAQPETMVVMRGMPGSGKSTFASLMYDLFYPHSRQLDNQEAAFGRWGAANAMHKRVVTLEEVRTDKKSGSDDTLKARITEGKKNLVELKGQDSKEVMSSTGYIYTTNDDWAVIASSFDRRLMITEVNVVPGWGKGSANWNTLRLSQDDTSPFSFRPEIVARFRQELLTTRKYKAGFHPRDIVNTAAKDAQKGHTWTLDEQLLQLILQQDTSVAHITNALWKDPTAGSVLVTNSVLQKHQLVSTNCETKETIIQMMGMWQEQNKRRHVLADQKPWNSEKALRPILKKIGMEHGKSKKLDGAAVKGWEVPDLNTAIDTFAATMNVSRDFVIQGSD